MFERFSDRARQVVVLAQVESRSLRHDYIGTEHLLLGLLGEREGVAARVLESLDVTLEGVRTQVRRLVASGPEMTSGAIPFTPRAKRVLELALRETLSLGHKDIDTEHLLLGLARENEGVAIRILLEFGVDARKLRREVMSRGSGLGGRPPPELSEERAEVWQPIASAWLESLGGALHQLTGEIRRQHGRGPDAGDLMLALAAASPTLAAQALGEAGIDLDALQTHVERLRQQRSHGPLVEQLEAIRQEKERAIEAQRFQIAARLRDQERELTGQLYARAILSPDVVDAIRRRLGLPTPPPTPPPT